MPPISSFFGRWLVENPFFLFAGTLLFDEKIRQNIVQPIFRTRLGDTKPLSKHKMFSSRIFRRPVLWKTWRFVQYLSAEEVP
jgi:hypothetical protein